jgi:hypothetical protein
MINATMQERHKINLPHKFKVLNFVMHAGINTYILKSVERKPIGDPYFFFAA